eukprot:scaffold118017_cov48-Phaeocystis_antarctica.AAC.3
MSRTRSVGWAATTAEKAGSLVAPIRLCATRSTSRVVLAPSAAVSILSPASPMALPLSSSSISDDLAR